MSTPNHEFPSGTQPQGSGQSPQTPAGYSYPQAQMPWQGQNPQTTWYSDPSQATMQAPQQTTRSLPRRRAEDLFLNVLLYLGSLLLIGSAALFITSITSQDRTSVILRVAGLGLGSLLFYSAGLITYKTVVRLRIASYSFTATGLALLPLTGIATYVLGLWNDGSLIWLLVSLVGTAAIILACSFMRNRVMAYVLISFFVSDALAATNVAALPFVWYFVALTVLAIILGLLIRLNSRLVPIGLREGLLESSRIFVPVTAIVVLFFIPQMSSSDMGIVFSVMSAHAFVFTALEHKLDYYVQARLYPFIALISFGWGLERPITVIVVLMGLYALHLLAVLVGYPLMQREMKANLPKHPIMRWDVRIDTYISIIFAAFVTFIEMPHALLTNIDSFPTGLEFMLLVHLDGVTFPRAWVFAVLCVGIITAYRKYLPAQEYVYLIAGISSGLSLMLLGQHESAFYLYFVTAGILMLTARKLQLPQLLVSSTTKIFLFLGTMHLLFTLQLGWGVRGILLAGALTITALGLFAALRYEMLPQKRSLTAFREILVYLVMAVVFFLLRSIFTWTPREVVDPPLDTSLYVVALLAVLALGFLTLRASSAYKDQKIVPLICIYLTLCGLGVAATSMNYLFPTGDWWAVGVLVLTSIYMFGMSYIIPQETSERHIMFMTSRFPMLWSVIVLWASNSIASDQVFLTASGLLLIQGLLSGILYMTRRQPRERTVFYIIFYTACLPGFIAPFVYSDNALFTAIFCPLAVLVLWGLGEAANLAMLRVCASIALLLTGYTVTNHMLNLNHPRFSEYVIYQGLAAALCSAVLYGLTTLLKREIPGKYDSLQPLNVQVENSAKVIQLPLHGPARSSKNYLVSQRNDSTRFYGPHNTFLMVPAIIAIAFWTFASIASEDTVQSALLWGLTALSFASVSTKRMLPTAIVAAPVAFTTRILLDFSVTGFFQSLLEAAILILLAVVASKILRNLIEKRPAQQGISAALIYTAIGLQGLLTIMAWGTGYLQQGAVIMLLGILLTALVSVVLDRIWVFVSAALVTVDLALLLNGLNPLTLMIISILLIAGVVWRLLARDQGPSADKQAPALPQNPYQGAPAGFAPPNGASAPYGQGPWAGQQPYQGYNQPNGQAQYPGYSQQHNNPNGNSQA